MIEYAKAVLPKVCLWKELFRKELIKCNNWIEKDEWNHLYKWCYENFCDDNIDVLEEVFNKKYSSNFNSIA